MCIAKDGDLHQAQNHAAAGKYSSWDHDESYPTRTHTHTYIPTYIPTYVRTYVHTHTHTHTYIHTYTHTHIHTYIHTYIHTQRETQGARPLHSQARMHAYGHLRTGVAREKSFLKSSFPEDSNSQRFSAARGCQRFKHRPQHYGVETRQLMERSGCCFFETNF